ncbi:hypothetical protein CTI12_AA044480 [Artemisia annua]|uniref:Homologous recombination OB-fold protein OB-fold domain-containing protein n=1 Tax=Artemisia annua TaxID=35608 RepID=A0A2U1QDB2_ARTAN|nr:hypothetical protein CTI12_AA044480 [Artemisia annua]
MENLVSSHNPEKSVRIIPGPAGIVQMVKRRKLADIREGGQECVITTQEYIMKIVEDVVRVGHGLASLRDIKHFIKNGKLEQGVAICKYCTPNALRDLTLTLKDLSGTISGTIHHKFLTEGSYGKAITVGVALILQHDTIPGNDKKQ